MKLRSLYELCLRNVLQHSCLNPSSLIRLPISCLRDILPYLSPYELERIDYIYDQRHIRTNDLWRRHFELIWSLSRDDRNSYESLVDIPYKRLYFEYLFHDTQILQLSIYAHLSQINLSKSIVHLSFIEHITYNLTRDSIIYCSKRRLLDDNQNLIIVWRQQWNKYVKRLILVPNVSDVIKNNPLLINCFIENITDIVLSGYPTENDFHSMKFILDMLTQDHITNMIIKFPSYCLINILSPLFIYPRTYSLSYLSAASETNVKHSNLFMPNLILPHHAKHSCLHVEIHSTKANITIPSRVSVNNQHANEQYDNTSTDTNHAIISYSNHDSHDSLDILLRSPNTTVRTQTSISGLHHELLQSNTRRFSMPLETALNTIMPTNESIDTISMSDLNSTTMEPYERLLPYLNQTRQSLITPVRYLSTSEQSVPRTRPLTHLITESISSSDSNLYRPHTTNTVRQPSHELNFIPKRKQNEIDQEQILILHLTPEYHTRSLTNLSIYYVSSFETIEMIAIALQGMNQINHLTLVNFAIYSSQLEASLISLCTRSQLQSLHLASISLANGAIGFLLNLFHHSLKSKTTNIKLKRLRLDMIKVFSLLLHSIHLTDVETVEFIPHSTLEQFIWRERHMQYIHMRLLYKFLPTILSKLHRLELSSVIECSVFDQYVWCQTLLHDISDVRLRNFRIRSTNLLQFFLCLNTFPYTLTAFHFERVGLTWNDDSLSTIIRNAFTSLILHAKCLNELSLAYNNLNNHFIDWLCEILLWYDQNSSLNDTSWWSLTIFNLTFNLITSESMRRLIGTLKEYTHRWQIRRSPIRRIDILGNAIDLREMSNLKKQFNTLGCDLTSNISS